MARYPEDAGFILTAVILAPVSRIAWNTVVPDVKLERGPNSSNFTDLYDIVSCRLLKYAILEVLRNMYILLLRIKQNSTVVSRNPAICNAMKGSLLKIGFLIRNIIYVSNKYSAL